MPSRKLISCVAAAVLAGAQWPGAAQQRVPTSANGTPVAPTGIAVAPLGPGPFVYETAEGQDIRVVVHARGLSHPWSLVWLPTGRWS